MKLQSNRKAVKLNSGIENFLSLWEQNKARDSAFGKAKYDGLEEDCLGSVL